MITIGKTGIEAYQNAERSLSQASDETNAYFKKNPKMKKAAYAAAISAITVVPIPGAAAGGITLLYLIDKKEARKRVEQAKKYLRSKFE